MAPTGQYSHVDCGGGTVVLAASGPNGDVYKCLNCGHVTSVEHGAKPDYTPAADKPGASA